MVGFSLENLKLRQVPYLRRKLGIVFQDFQLLTDRSVYDNLYFVLHATGWKDKDAIDEQDQAGAWRKWSWKTRVLKCLISCRAESSSALLLPGHC